MLTLTFVAAFLLRILLSPAGFHIDLLSNAGWGEWIFKNGPMGFYENNIWVFAWPTQPPLMSLIYGFDYRLYWYFLETLRTASNLIVRFHLAPGHMVWFFEFTKWIDVAKVNPESSFTTGFLATIKLLPILADLGIAAIIYRIALLKSHIKYKVLFPAVYLFSPFSWYLSSLWGQYDQVGFLFVLMAFVFEANKKLAGITPFLFALSIAIKPTSLLLLPFFIYVYLKNKHPLRYYLFSTILIALLFYITTDVFTNQNVFAFSKDTLYGKIFLKAASRLSANAFNFWRIIQSSSIQTQDSNIIFIPAYLWSYAAFVFLNILAIKMNKIVNLKNIFSGMFIISAGSWLFMTNMLDRYFFAGIVSVLLLSIYDLKILKYFIPLSLIFWINLYNQWWFPESFDSFKSLLLWNNALATKVLAAINIFLFFKIYFSIPSPKTTAKPIKHN